MACVQVQCFVPPCPEICDGTIFSGSPSTVDRMVWSTEQTPIASRNIDPRLLMYAPKTITRSPGTYTGGQYPSAPPPQPDFVAETSELDWWRLVVLALGIVIGAVIIKRM